MKIRTIIALLSTLSVGCGSILPGSSDEPVVVDLTGYDRSCDVHSDCVAVTACVCNCATTEVPDSAIQSGDESRFAADRANVDCVSTVEPDYNSLYLPVYAVCVDARCEVSETEPFPPADATPPEQWNRSCQTSSDCRTVPVNQCALEPWCGGEFEAINRESDWPVDEWNRACDQFIDNDATCDVARFGAYCSDEQCESVQLSDDPADPDTCHELHDARSCVEAGCRLIEFAGLRLVEGVCESTMATVCLARGTGYEESNNPTRRPYYRDEVAMLSPTTFAGWSPCDDETPVCACLE